MRVKRCVLRSNLRLKASERERRERKRIVRRKLRRLPCAEGKKRHAHRRERSSPGRGKKRYRRWPVLGEKRGGRRNCSKESRPSQEGAASLPKKKPGDVYCREKHTTGAETSATAMRRRKGRYRAEKKKILVKGNARSRKRGDDRKKNRTGLSGAIFQKRGRNVVIGKIQRCNSKKRPVCGNHLDLGKDTKPGESSGKNRASTKCRASRERFAITKKEKERGKSARGRRGTSCENAETAREGGVGPEQGRPPPLSQKRKRRGAAAKAKKRPRGKRFVAGKTSRSRDAQRRGTAPPW